MRFETPLFPCFAMLVPVVEHVNFAKGLLGDRWLALGQSGQEEESLLNIGV